MFSRLGSVIHEHTMIYTAINYTPLGQMRGLGETVFDDPQLVGWENGTINFKPDSPAHKLGIKSIDVSTAGLKK